MIERALFAALLGVLACAPAAAQDHDFSQDDGKIMGICLDGARTATSDEPSAADDAARLDDCIGAISGPCITSPAGMTTIGANQCMARETDWWDAFLNARYAAMRDSFDKESGLALRDAQRAWIAFRDAECNLHYTYWGDGSIRSTLYARCMLDMTAKRAIDLDSLSRWGLE